MNRIDSVEPGFYQDTSRLKKLNGKEGLEAAASEFEAMFLQMVLKNMRDASQAIAGENSLFSSQQQQFYQEMADGQLASEMARRGNLGIAEAMVRQMSSALGEQASGQQINTELKNSSDSVASTNVSTAAFQQPLNRPRNSEEQ
jgi:flagellar protein FlgJ